MKITSKCKYGYHFSWWRIFLLCIIVQVFGITQLQAQTSLTLHMRNATVEQILNGIEKNSAYHFLYNKNLINVNRQIKDFSVKKETIQNTLNKIFSDGSVIYTIKDNQIVLSRAPSTDIKDKKDCKITGKVVDETGDGLPGTTILVNDTPFKAITNADGSYEITVPRNSTIQFKYLGCIPQSRKVSSSTTLDITLREDQKILNDIVVIGYGTTTRKNLTTSISSVKPEKISKATNSNISQLLVGRAAGLQATITSVQPGGQVDLSIRGAGTPVYVVDGVMMPAGSLEVGNGTTEIGSAIRRSGLAGLNPADIESIEVLKDASAAIYGIGAANGVILITTKKGSESKPVVTYDGSYSIVKNYKYLEPLSGSELMNIANVYSKENYLFTKGMYPYGNKAFDNKWVPQFSNTDIQNAINTNWLDLVLKTGAVNNHNISVSGGSKYVKYYVSGNYFNQQGTVKNSSMERYVLNTKISMQWTPFLRLTAMANINQNYYVNSLADGGRGGHASGAIQTALVTPSYLPIYDSDGNPTHFRNYSNPVEMTKIRDKTKTNGYYVNVSADIDFIKNILSARLLYGTNKENANRDLFIPSNIYYYQMYQSRGHLGYIERLNQTYEATLSFNKKFWDKLNVNVVLGCGKYTSNGNGLQLDYQKINDHINSEDVSAAEGIFSPTSYKSGDERRSQFARAGLDLFDRYILSATLRRDGTDKFFKNKKYAWFPSVSAAWKITNEKFMKNIPWINLLKLRASYGETGSDNLGSSLYGNYYVSSRYIKFSNNSTTYIPYLLSGPDYPYVTWQKTKMKNIGIDFSVLNDRIWGSFDIFRNDVTNLLGATDASVLSMTTSIPMNYGHYMRCGWDGTINSINLDIPNIFRWTSLLTLTHYNNIWIKRQPNYYYQEYQYRKREPMSAIYFYETDGIINIDKSNIPASQASLSADAQQPGYPIIKDQNKDGKITIDDIKMRNTLPTLSVGLGNTFTYKNFDLDIFLYGSFGQWRYNYAYAYASPGQVYYTNPSNTTKYIYTNWNSQTALNGKRSGIAATKSVALPGNVGFVEDYKNASFVRVRNITLGYNLDGNKLGFIGNYINSIRVYFDCQNPFTFTKYEGVDPEIYEGNSEDHSGYPMNRTYSFGLKLVF
jgi:TonB-linked SusC/RagA family outer membrane protein